MVKSMTGYGNASYEDEKYRINVEVKSLNSKFTDISVRIPRLFSDKEIEIRNLLSKFLERGKMNFALEFQVIGEVDSNVSINENLANHFYQQLLALAQKNGASTEGLFLKALEFPQVIETGIVNKASEEEWILVQSVIKKAIANCEEFRTQEGLMLKKEFTQYIQHIEKSLNLINLHDAFRIEHVRKRIADKINEVVSNDDFDANRYEQELIYYIEKLDITEEKVRLQNHLTYFLEELNAKENTGKKLGFICQEIGREINTIGSKANDANLQKYVVSMKEELEKIKEQSLNIL